MENVIVELLKLLMTFSNISETIEFLSEELPSCIGAPLRDSATCLMSTAAKCVAAMLFASSCIAKANSSDDGEAIIKDAREQTEENLKFMGAVIRYAKDDIEKFCALLANHEQADGEEDEIAYLCIIIGFVKRETEKATSEGHILSSCVAKGIAEMEAINSAK